MYGLFVTLIAIHRQQGGKFWGVTGRDQLTDGGNDTQKRGRMK
ncbi:hypothetical protein OIU76_024041 [Salix suchowensis]|nr:hypothetical protein OIU76_024041 [Salix suchowensis]